MTWFANWQSWVCTRKSKCNRSEGTISCHWWRSAGN